MKKHFDSSRAHQTSHILWKWLWFLFSLLFFPSCNWYARKNINNIKVPARNLNREGKKQTNIFTDKRDRNAVERKHSVWHKNRNICAFICTGSFINMSSGMREWQANAHTQIYIFIRVAWCGEGEWLSAHSIIHFQISTNENSRGYQRYSQLHAERARESHVENKFANKFQIRYHWIECVRNVCCCLKQWFNARLRMSWRVNEPLSVLHVENSKILVVFAIWCLSRATNEQISIAKHFGLCRLFRVPLKICEEIRRKSMKSIEYIHRPIQ